MNRQKIISAIDNALQRHTARVMAKEPDFIASVAAEAVHPSQAPLFLCYFK